MELNRMYLSIFFSKNKVILFFFLWNFLDVLK